jgi:peptidoglycan/xylan/chitin deacetylase (PgdA/CDA1 family)
MLKRSGYQTVSIEQFAGFMRGDLRRLPARPVLLTFDDGQTSSFRGADRVLERYGFRATMFAISEHGGADHPYYLRWDDLRAMRQSGRWDVQLHAGHGHREVQVDDRGRRGPAYANRAYADGRLETFAEFQRRVTSDLRAAFAELRRELPGTRPLAFAAPFGNVGQENQPTNDRRIGPFMRGWIAANLGQLVLVQRGDFTTPDRRKAGVYRLQVTGETDTDEHCYLRQEAPGGRPDSLCATRGHAEAGPFRAAYGDDLHS